MSFDALTSLSPEVAEVLVAVEGPLSFTGLTELSPAAAAVLARHRPAGQFGHADLRLNGLKRLSPEGVLVLNDLALLEPPVAAALARRVGNRKGNRPGTLVLNGLPAISAEAAAALAAFSGELVLKGITELSPEAAAAIARHKGRLHLTGLAMISPETRAALQGHAQVFLPRPSPTGPGIMDASRRRPFRQQERPADPCPPGRSRAVARTRGERWNRPGMAGHGQGTTGVALGSGAGADRGHPLVSTVGMA